MAGAQVAGPLGAPFQPNFTPASPLLTRMYGLHAAVLPIVLVVLLSLHLWLVRHLGVRAAGDASTPFRSCSSPSSQRLPSPHPRRSSPQVLRA